MRKKTQNPSWAIMSFFIVVLLFVVRQGAAEQKQNEINTDDTPAPSPPCGPSYDGCLNGVGYDTSTQFPCGNDVFDIATSGCCEGIWFNLDTQFCCAGSISDKLGGSQACQTIDLDRSLDEQGISDPSIEEAVSLATLLRDNKPLKDQDVEEQKGQDHNVSRLVLDDDVCTPSDSVGCVNNVPYNLKTQYVCGDGSIVTRGEGGCCMDTPYNKEEFQCCNGVLTKKYDGIESCFVLCIPTTSHSCLNNANFDSLLYQVCGSTIVPFWAHCCNGDVYDPQKHTCCGDALPSPLSQGTCSINLGAIDVHELDNLSEEGWRVIDKINGPWLTIVSPDENGDLNDYGRRTLDSEIIDVIDQHSPTPFPEPTNAFRTTSDSSSKKTRAQESDASFLEDREGESEYYGAEVISNSKKGPGVEVPCSKYTAVPCVFPRVNEGVRFFCFNRKLYREGMCYVCLDKVIFRGTYACCDGSSYRSSGTSCCDGEIIAEKKACKFFGF